RPHYSTLSLHDALPISMPEWMDPEGGKDAPVIPVDITQKVPLPLRDGDGNRIRLWICRDKGHIDAVSGSTLVSEKIPKRWDLPRSEEHTSELQSRFDLV